MEIERLNNIEDIIALQKKYYDENGILPLNVSNWTVSADFRKQMEFVFQHDVTNSPIDYLYSYNISIEHKENIMKKLGMEEKHLATKTCIIFPNNSLSIVNICNLLKKMHLKRVGILYPAYFSIASCMSTYGITCIPFFITRHNHKYIIPQVEILDAKLDALWITSPIYSTGTSYSLENIKIIETLLKKNSIIIADESFCTKNQELARRFAKYKNFIGIYSPHKAISFNSYKFSAILCDNCYEDFFDQWLDVFSGNLPQTTIAAIHHYLSNNYNECYQSFESFIQCAYSDVISILKKFSNIETDDIINGNLMTLYIKHLKYEDTKDLNTINKIIENTHTLFYPGYLNGFSKDMGFCFRINLALYNPDFLASLERLLRYLNSRNI